MYPSTLYLAGADSTAVKAGLPVLSVASDSLVLRAVAAAAWTGRAHAVVAPREVDTHAVVPASVCLQAALINIWKTEAGHRKLKSGLSGEKGTSGHFSWTHARVSIFVRTLIECMHRQPLPLQPNPNFNLEPCDNQPKCHTKVLTLLVKYVSWNVQHRKTHSSHLAVQIMLEITFWCSLAYLFILNI